MVNCLRALGVKVVLAEDPLESANRTITVHGTSGVIAPGGPPERPLELCVGNAGTAARFIAALVCLGRGNYRLTGSARMHERPQAALFDALRQLGYSIDTKDGRLPALVNFHRAQMVSFR